ncbi:uncharacterized protein YdaU (DUF1376 family) [Tepidimonas ignava]|uniref:Uncharacterized protein YdaU (DUF1376 family) n=1 Tax=Tepidimonas ignava TaxID=114249 RepID=A0A4R3L399_9BURK|nr:YdaU family protein [Tepidimonas ignava]TCS94093.1 uncharacterized protein YdaU (DUF1376 family) [Tepidimonas ignava]TSE18919.1 hypothetical protein Tigna_02366 [Tepidimonas ignava]
MKYFQLNIGDYAQATAHLTWLEEAAYWRLLRRYYADERALPADIQAVQRMVGARTRWEKQAVETVLREFFTLEDDGWHHKRCDAEIERYRAKQEKARASVSKRWGARADGKPASGNSESTCDLTHSQNASRLESESRKSLISQDQGDTNVSQTQYQPITNNQEPRTNIVGTPTSLLTEGGGGVGEGAHRAQRATRSQRGTQAAVEPPTDVEPQVWSDWLAVRKAKRAGPVTQTVMAALRREADKAGITLQEAVAACCEAGWQGFKAEWYDRRCRPSPLAEGVLHRPLAAHPYRSGFKSARQSLIEGAAAAIFEDATHV